MEMLSKYKIKLLESPIPPLSVCLSSVTKKRWPLSATLHIFPRRVTKTLAGFSLGLIKADDDYDDFDNILFIPFNIAHLPDFIVF